MESDYIFIDYEEKENVYISSFYVSHIKNRNVYKKKTKSSNTYTFLITQITKFK